eukprot:1308392-Lingulodinium_polyedra.AAC.1
MLSRSSAVDCLVSAAAVGVAFSETVDGVTQDVFLRKKWRISSTHPGIPIELEPYANAPTDIPKRNFVQRRGK